jgi:hypothetical protein
VSESSFHVVTALAPLMIAVLVGFLVIGAALPILPLHVHDELGFGPVMVGAWWRDVSSRPPWSRGSGPGGPPTREARNGR